MGYHGPLFTWCNKREEGLICKKLDRVLINEVWLHNLKAYCVFEPGGVQIIYAVEYNLGGKK